MGDLSAPPNRTPATNSGSRWRSYAPAHRDLERRVRGARDLSYRNRVRVVTSLSLDPLRRSVTHSVVTRRRAGDSFFDRGDFAIAPATRDGDGHLVIVVSMPWIVFCHSRARGGILCRRMAAAPRSHCSSIHTKPSEILQRFSAVSSERTNREAQQCHCRICEAGICIGVV